jgi:glycosyltransferase involved in cell wall biosynthesis
MIESRKFKLLHICSYSWEIGGPPSVIFNLSNSYKDQVNTDIVTTLTSNHTLYSIFSGQRIFVFKKSFLSKIIPDFSIKSLFWFIKNVFKYDFVVVHGLWNFGSVLAFFLPKRTRLILTIHGFLDPYVLKRSRFKKKLFWFIFQKYCFKKASIIHAISLEEEMKLKKMFPHYKNKIIFIPNGIQDPLLIKNINQPNTHFKNLINSFLMDSVYTFLYLGRINKKKGIDLIIESFYRLVEKQNTANIKLIIAGPIDNYDLEFQELQKRFIHTNILILPSVILEEKIYLFKKVNAFLLPSYSEGFSIAALEAISYGKACIFSKNIGFSNEAFEEHSALICDLSVKSLMEKMSLLINDYELNLLLSKNSRDLFLRNYQIDSISKRYYKEIILSNE